MSGELLAHIGSPADVKALDAADLPQLCAEIRAALVAYGKSHGGHIGSNLGIVEATVALHRVFDSPRDRIVFDVSHQSYVHKMLTGRARAYLDPALADSVTGFTNPAESEHDQFVLGHTGTSISLACGLAKTRDLLGGPGGAGGVGNVVAVIGDGALSSAIAFEGLNNAAEQGGNLIIVFNDNEMSIAEDFGGMYGPLARLRASGGTAEPNIFRAFGLDYRYVEHGNDVAALVEAFEQVRDCDHPVVVHIHTRKGLGLDAEDAAHGIRDGRCEANHWQDPFRDAAPEPGPRKYYGEMAMAALESRFADEPGLVVVSPATPGSNGITRAFRERAGAHYVDTGIAEEHAVTFASGIAKAGGRPVVATSATFFQRTFDELQQEVALNRTPVTLLVFAAGVSDADNTHSGAFDIAMMANIPGLACLAPTCRDDFLDMLAWSTSAANHGPVAIRVPGEAVLAAERAGGYPRHRNAGRTPHADEPAAAPAPGDEPTTGLRSTPHAAPAPQTADPTAGSRSTPHTAPALDSHTMPRTDAQDAQSARFDAGTPWDRYLIAHRGADVAVIGLGDAYPLAERVAALLADDGDSPVDATLVDPRRYDRLDAPTLDRLAEDHRVVVTIEDGQLDGGWGERITAYYANRDAVGRAGAPDAAGRSGGGDGGRGPIVLNVGAAKEFTDRVPLAELHRRYGMEPERIAARIRGAIASCR